MHPRVQLRGSWVTLQSNRAERMRVEEMATDMLHELNQPLVAIANYAQASARLLEADSTDLTQVRAALEQISAQAIRAGHIVRRLRTLSHDRMILTGGAR